MAFSASRRETFAMQTRPPDDGACIVHTVVDGTPAKRFGLEVGDIITHVDERPIFDADGLVLQVGKKAHDAVVRLMVERNGHTIPINVQLTKYAMRGRQVISTPAPELARPARRLRHDCPRLPGVGSHAPDSEPRVVSSFPRRREQPGLAGRAAAGKDRSATSTASGSVRRRNFMRPWPARPVR